MRYLILLLFIVVTGCTVSVHAPPPNRIYTSGHVYVEPPPRSVVSVYIEPQIEQPPPIAVRWAPPPMLVMAPSPQPYPGAVWIGGYWVWDGDWVWAAGRWADPPRPRYRWVHPYYENRDGLVVFIDGHWSSPESVFVPPAIGINISIGLLRPGIIPGPPPVGPSGVFVPAPPGSRLGIIIPAPVGTPPAVVTGAPPVINIGMRINNHVTNINSNNTTINKTTINNITTITNVTIIAPASATATGQAVNSTVPAQSHLAAAQRPVVRVDAPRPVSSTPVPAYVPGKPFSQLPPSQTVKPVVPPELRQKQQDHNLGQQRKDHELRQREDALKREQDKRQQEIVQKRQAQDAARLRDLEHQRKDQELRQREIANRREQEVKKKAQVQKQKELKQKDQDAHKKQEEHKKKELEEKESK